MRKRLIHKFIISTVIVAIACFVYSSLFYRISAQGQENSTQKTMDIQETQDTQKTQDTKKIQRTHENQEIQTSAIIESQSKSMRNIRFYRRSQ